MTARIALLTTGRCEQLGLPKALDHALGAHADVVFTALGEFHSFTSAFLDVGHLSKVDTAAVPQLSGPVDKLAEALIAEAAFGSWDLVVAIDDLELVNARNASGVRAFFGSAVVHAIQRARLTSAQEARIAKRASFHLLAPMVEAYFFGERAAVERACVHAGLEAAPSWPERAWPIEEFEIDDPEYVNRSSAPDLPKAQRSKKAISWRAENRERHPKHYMEFLCRASQHGYHEAKEGVAALRELNFHDVLRAGAPMLNDLLEDIRDLLQVDPSVLPTSGPLSGSVLRNL